jgi:23S rRNA U2552 (ribose-2'-O)-methylase RlmE/FtsJ
MYSMQWHLNGPLGGTAPNENALIVSRLALNSVKDSIGYLKCKTTFRAAAAWTNPCEKLSTYAPFQLHSRAYFKLWEILRRFPLPVSDRMHSLHLCEAPGGFVQATEQFTKRYKTEWSWHGVTLPNALQWKGGSKDNVIYADVICDDLPPCCYHADLVTGDGGFQIDDSQVNDQEALNLPLFCAQINKAVACCVPGGMIVIKLFDMFQPQTRAYIHDEAMCWFQDSYICKPYGSRICNSERFFVGICKLEERCTMNCEAKLREVAMGLVDVQTQALQNAIYMAREYDACDVWTALKQSWKHDKKAQEVAKWLKII